MDSFENVRCRSAEGEPNLRQTTLDAGGEDDFWRSRRAWRGREKCALSRIDNKDDNGAEKAACVS